ncbi:hypothetical protein BaRGS_00021294 [Batillaria attramentaria]|uniref:Uncharacterized protein n=1 Tax=Batillaria attramentaria TaxID=370345 RepID=A0ABD0KK12_9CAEN
MLAARAYEACKMALSVRYFSGRSRDADDEASYVSINLTDDGSGAETDNTYESIKSRLLEGKLLRHQLYVITYTSSPIRHHLYVIPLNLLSV